MELFLLCLKIFFARIVDVSLGTIRTVYIVKEKRFIAALIAFAEVLIWFEIAREALNTEISSIFIPISYAAGYATGTFIGTFVSATFVRGHLTLIVISSVIKQKDIDTLKRFGYGVSVLSNDKKKILLLEIDKRNSVEIKKLLLSMDEKAFIIVYDSKLVENGYIK